jgi:hypothetical protein
MAFLAAEAQGGEGQHRGPPARRDPLAHKPTGHEQPTDGEAVEAATRSIRRTAAASVQNAPAAADLVHAKLDACRGTLQGRRDCALLTLGFAGACRRSGLVALQLDDLLEAPDGFRLSIGVERGPRLDFGAGQGMGSRRHDEASSDGV